MALVNNLKRLVRRAVVAQIASDGTDSPMGRDEYTMDRCEWMKRLLEKASDWMDTYRNSLAVEQVTSEPAIDGPDSRSEKR